MTGATGETAGAAGVIDVDEVERLATWAAGFGPSRLRTDMHAEARLRVLEALAAGCTTGLARAAYCGAASAFRSGEFQAGSRRSRVALDRNVGPMILGLVPVENVGLAGWGVPWGDGGRSSYYLWGSEGFTSAGVTWGPVLDRLRDELVGRGVDRDGLSEALGTLLDATNYSHVPRAREGLRKSRSVTGRRSRVFDVSVGLMAEQSGLSVGACRALKVLILGERPRPERGRSGAPGLLARASQGDDVWADPRVERLLSYVAQPVGALRCVWAEPTAAPSPTAPVAS